MDRRTKAELFLRESSTKRAILRLIENDPKSLSQLARELRMTAPTIFQHGEELESLGLVTKDRVAGRAFLALTPLGRELIVAGYCRD